MRLPAPVRRHFDEILAGALAGAFQLEMLLEGSTQEEPTLVPLIFLMTLPLAFRRRLPVASFLVLWGAAFAVGAVLQADVADQSVLFLVVFAVSLYSLGAYAAGREAWAGGCLIAVGVVLFTATDGDSFAPADVLFGTLLVAGPWAAGLAIRLRRQRESALSARAEQLVAENEETARLAVADERSRIARELHDVVSHAISVTVLQARGGRRMLGVDDEQARRAFDAIEQTNQAALGDMRRLLGLLRETEAGPELVPAPSLARLDDLLGQLRASGMHVELAVTGDPATLPPGVDLTAFRIIQEATTNALKHARGSRVRVVVDYGRDAVALSIHNDQPVRRERRANGATPGHGLIGIRERVSVVGGEVEIGPEPNDAGFRVRALLPYSVDG